MAGRFDFFVMLADMRTGSNFLEASLNRFADLACHGEPFNPHFVGHHNDDEMFGMDVAAREADPLRLIELMRQNTDGLAGFRFFHDHDPRVLRHCLDNPRCGKIVLTRNPLEAHISHRIAIETGQWKLRDARHKRTAKIEFDEADFAADLAARQSFQRTILHALQVSGQTAFYIDYEDLRDCAAINGLARYLGSRHQISALDKTVKKQNPESLEDKVLNHDEMMRALGRVDHFGLSRTPSFEPRRGAGVPQFRAGVKVPLLHLPIRGGPVARVDRWLAALDGQAPEALQSGFTQKSLRQWKRAHPGFRSFTVLRHPAARAHSVFCEMILAPDHPRTSGLRKILRHRYKLPISAGVPGPDYGRKEHHAAFLAFLAFLKGNLVGQTSIRVDPAWATQAALLEGICAVSPPDMVLREAELDDELGRLAAKVGRKAPPLAAAAADRPFTLGEIHDREIEKLLSQVYRRDYAEFGFGPWRAPS